MKENKEKSGSSETLVNQSLGRRKPCWYWDKEALSKTPSQLYGLDPATEARYRRDGARFTFDIGKRLRLPHVTVATGIIYFHRFYMYHSFKYFPRYVTAACALFLAGKVEETPKRCNDVLKTARSLLNDAQFRQFGDDPKGEITSLELVLLQTINFDFQVELPYEFLLKYTKELKGDKSQIEKLLQMAWTFVNDSLCTTLSLQCKPDTIAVSMMYLAGHLCAFEIQEWTSKPTYKRWWEQFVPDLHDDVLQDICHQLLDLYSQENKQIPLHTPPQLQQPESLQSTPQVPSLKCCDNSSAYLKILNSGSPKRKRPRRQPEQEQQEAQQSKKPSPQPNSPKRIKQSLVVSSKEDNKAAESTPSKISQIETIRPARLPVQAPPECKPGLTGAVSIGEAEQTSTVELGDLPKVQIPPPPSYSAPVFQPPPLPHYTPLLPSSYLTETSNTSSYMSEEGYQNMQSMMNEVRPHYGVLPPAYEQPTHLPYHPHIYNFNALSLHPPPLASFPSSIIPTPTSVYFRPEAYNFYFQPPQLPPVPADPHYSSSEFWMPPSSYPPPFVLQEGQPPVPYPISKPCMSTVNGLSHST